MSHTSKVPQTREKLAGTSTERPLPFENKPRKLRANAEAPSGGRQPFAGPEPKSRLKNHKERRLFKVVDKGPEPGRRLFEVPPGDDPSDASKALFPRVITEMRGTGTPDAPQKGEG